MAVEAVEVEEMIVDRLQIAEEMIVWVAVAEEVVVVEMILVAATGIGNVQIHLVPTQIFLGVKTVTDAMSHDLKDLAIVVVDVEEVWVVDAEDHQCVVVVEVVWVEVAVAALEWEVAVEAQVVAEVLAVVEEVLVVVEEAADVEVDQ